MSLLAVHRLLIKTFIAAALAFGWITLRRWNAGEPGGSLIGGIAVLVLALAAAVYLLRAPHLRRK